MRELAYSSTNAWLQASYARTHVGYMALKCCEFCSKINVWLNIPFLERTSHKIYSESQAAYTSVNLRADRSAIALESTFCATVIASRSNVQRFFFFDVFGELRRKEQQTYYDMIWIVLKGAKDVCSSGRRGHAAVSHQVRRGVSPAK